MKIKDNLGQDIAIKWVEDSTFVVARALEAVTLIRAENPFHTGDDLLWTQQKPFVDLIIAQVIRLK